MTRDELLAKIDSESAWIPDFIFTLRKVVELHMYFGKVQEDSSVRICCIACSSPYREYLVSYPCETIKLIEKEI